MSTAQKLPTVSATRYITPLREGGSMPGLMEASDDGLYAVKFRAAGQGTLALAAELISAHLAQALGVRVPRRALVEVDAAIGTAEPDPEIQELIVASPGINLGSDFLPGARTYSAADAWQPEPPEAATIVWLDALINNVDRSPRNPNLLIWHDQLWAIDHGAALYRQHAGLGIETATAPFAQIADHVLLHRASSIVDADAELSARLGADVIEDAVDAVPADWFVGPPPAAYKAWLLARLKASTAFSREAEDARQG